MANNSPSNQDFNVLKGKVESIIDMISNKPELPMDAERIKNFLEKYSIVEALLTTDTIETVISKIDKLNENMDVIQKEVEGPLLVAQQQSEKIIQAYTQKDVNLSLNVADIKMFKSEIFSTFKDFTEYLNKLDISGKMKELDDENALLKSLRLDIIAQKDQLNNILEQIEKEEELIGNVQETNKQQDFQINYVNNLIATVEKQIENYAFFANEFNKIYLNAKNFITKFSEALETLNEIEQRDTLLFKIVGEIASVIETDYSVINGETRALKSKIDEYTKEMLSWLNYSMMFVNEVKAYNLSLGAYNDKMDVLKQKANSVIIDLDSVTLV